VRPVPRPLEEQEPEQPEAAGGNRLLHQLQQTNVQIDRRQQDRIAQLRQRLAEREKEQQQLAALTREKERDRDRLEELIEAKMNVINGMGEKGAILSEESKRLVADVKKAFEAYEAEKRALEKAGGQLLTLQQENSKAGAEIDRLCKSIEGVRAESIKKDQKCQKAQLELTACKAGNKERAILSAQ
jgi:hypothetical protein